MSMIGRLIIGSSADVLLPTILYYSNTNWCRSARSIALFCCN